jgi:hypothetical protein
VRRYLRQRIAPERLLAAIETSLDSPDERQRLAASKLLLGEFAETDPPAVEPVEVPQPEYDYPAILDKLEQVGVAVRSELPSLGAVFERAWVNASEVERAGFLAEVERVRADENSHAGDVFDA